LQEIRRLLQALYVLLGSGQKMAYSIPEAAEATSFGRTLLYDDIAAGRLKAKKRGTRTYILADELRRYLDSMPDAKP